MDVILPKPLLRGTETTRSIQDIMRKREPEYEHMFHGADEGLEHLAHFYIPPFQRPAVWTVEQKQRLIESMWLGISIGKIAVSAEGRFDHRTGKYSPAADYLIDGQQRLRAIKSYLEEGLRVFVGTSSEHCWNDLSIVQRRRFNGISVGMVMIEDDFDLDALKETYNRLNFGGTAHTEDQRA